MVVAGDAALLLVFVASRFVDVVNASGCAANDSTVTMTAVVRMVAVKKCADGPERAGGKRRFLFFFLCLRTGSYSGDLTRPP